LIEGRAMAQSDIKITFEDLKAFTTKKYPSTNGTIGQTNPTDEEVQGIVARVLSNQDEVKNFLTKLAEKLLEFKEKANQQLKKLLTTNLLLRLTENKFLKSKVKVKS
jgi:trigger factor